MSSSGGTFKLTQVNNVGNNMAVKNIPPYQNLTLVQKHSYEKAKHQAKGMDIKDGVIFQTYQPYDTPHTIQQRQQGQQGQQQGGRRKRMIRKKFGFREIRAGKVAMNSQGSLSIVASTVKPQLPKMEKPTPKKKRRQSTMETTTTSKSYMRPTTSQASRASATRTAGTRRASTPVSYHSRTGKGKRSRAGSRSSVFSVYSSDITSQATPQPIPPLPENEPAVDSADFHRSVSEVAGATYSRTTPSQPPPQQQQRKQNPDHLSLNPSTEVTSTNYTGSDFSSVPSSVYSSRIFELEEALRNERRTRHQFEAALKDVQKRQDELLVQLSNKQKEQLEAKTARAVTPKSIKQEAPSKVADPALMNRLRSTEDELNKLKTIVNTLTSHLATSSIDDDRMKKILTKIHQKYPDTVSVPPMMPTNPHSGAVKSTRTSYTQNYSGGMICQFP